MSNKQIINKKGQTLILSVMIMFVLAAVAGVFIAIVARNLERAQRYSSTDAVLQIAESGVNYADRMLVSSEDGADWRPVPDNDGIDKTQPYNIITGLATEATDWATQRDKYPDFKWTRAYWPTEKFPVGHTPGPGEIGFAGPTGGFSTYKMGQGRFLLRVSYNPNPEDPLSKNIKIESIGRFGAGLEYVNGQPDPTTMKPFGDSSMRREITAYKPIGITDYARFITNKDNRSMDFALGTPGFDTNFGRTATGLPAIDSKYGYRGGPVRVNGNLTWFGDDINLCLRSMKQNDGALVPIDMVEVAGDIKWDDDNLKVIVNRVDSLGAYIDSKETLQSNNNLFTTVYGFYRDGSDNLDVSTDPITAKSVNAPRGVKRIEPPVIDQSDLTDTTIRYRLLSLNSGDTSQSGGINLGRYGWGRGVYINNTRDTQSESESLFGGYTLRNDWLNPNNRISTYWKGQYYVPPGAIITLNPGDTDGDNQPDFTITRTDYNDSGQKATWFDASGKSRADWGSSITMPYPDPVCGRRLTANMGGANNRIQGNGIIFAEGNIRIKGMLPYVDAFTDAVSGITYPAHGMQLTIVSNENIYIEGNLLKYRDPNAAITANDPWRGTGVKTESCGLALLARGSVCVNSTQFFASANSISSGDIGSDSKNGDPPYHIIVNDDPTSSPGFIFDFGPYESENGAAPTSWIMALRHAGEYGPAYINAWLNPSSTSDDWGILYLNPNVASFPRSVYGVGDPAFTPAGWGLESAFAGDTFDLTNALNSVLLTKPGERNYAKIALDQSYYTRNNYLMGGFAVQPMDVRIEALLYAQEGSFFVIPGNWFNPDPSDTRASRSGGSDPSFPCYGDPLDIRVIIDGAISENISASSSDTEAWMKKWGRIPPTYGSSGTPTAHPGEGFTVLYDDHLGWPLTNLRSGVRSPIRSDRFGRSLPIAPRLPVSGSLIYTGDIE